MSEDQGEKNVSKEKPLRPSFLMPTFRYNGDVPSCCKPVFNPTADITSIAATNINGAHLRYIGKGRSDILQITTVDPTAIIFFGNMGINSLKVYREISVPPGTYRFLSGILNHNILILHSTFPDYKYVNYTMDNFHRGKLRQLQISTTIAGKDYCYFNGNLELPTDFSETETVVPKQIPAPNGIQKCCPTCRQYVPLESPKTRRKREEKNKKRLPENYPFHFKRKIQEVCDTGLIK